MIFSSWNIRGIGKPNLWSDLGVICKIENIQLMAIIETKSEIPPIDTLWKSAGFDKMIYCPAKGLSGGMCILWKSFQLTFETIAIHHIDDRFVSIHYTNTNTGFVFYIIFVYAPPNYREKSEFWNKIQNFIQALNLPYIIIGDLNEIQCAEEKQGGAENNQTRFRRLLDFKENNELTDLQTMGNEFTWRKKKTGP